MLQHCRGERKLSLSQPQMLRGFWKIKHLSSFSAWFHTRHPGCPGSSRQCPLAARHILLQGGGSGSNSPTCNQDLNTQGEKCSHFQNQRHQFCTVPNPWNMAKAISGTVSQSRIIFPHHECTSIFEIRLKKLFADVKIQTSLNNSNVPNSL